REDGGGVVRLGIDEHLRAAWEVELEDALHPLDVGDVDAQRLRVELPRCFQIAHCEAAECLAVLEHERLLRAARYTRLRMPQRPGGQLPVNRSGERSSRGARRSRSVSG